MAQTIDTTAGAAEGADATAGSAETPTYKLFIAGEWVESTSGKTFESRNPADTREVIGHFQAGTAADVAMAVRGAEMAGVLWRRTPAPKRGEILYRFGALMTENKERLARAMTREMGKVLAESRGDVQEGIDIAFLMAGEKRPDISRSYYPRARPRSSTSARTPSGSRATCPAPSMSPSPTSSSRSRGSRPTVTPR